jgi:hypothetical protein
MSQPPEQPYPARGATLQQLNLPEEEIPTRRTPRVMMPTQQSSPEEVTDGRAAASAADEIDETPTQRIRRIKTPTHHSSTQQKTNPPAADPAADENEETPTQRIRRINTPTQQSSTQDKTDRPAVRHAAVEAEKVEPAPDGSENADTVNMPSVLAAFSGGREPAADTEKSDGQKLDPTAARTENADTPPAGPDDADPLEMPPVRPAVRAGGDPSPAPGQQVVGPVPTRSPARNKRLVSAGLAAIALSAGLVGALSVSSRDAGELTAQSVATDTATASTTASKATSGASTGSTRAEKNESTIQVKGLAASARPFQTVRIQGKYSGRAETYLRVQHWDEGKWLAFPLPTKTDQSGKFTAYVELGQPGRYPLRVVDPNSGTTSKTLVILIES